MGYVAVSHKYEAVAADKRDLAVIDLVVKGIDVGFGGIESYV